MNSTAVPLSGVSENPIADQFRSENSARLEALFELLWKFDVEGNLPSGVEPSSEGYATSSDDQARTVKFNLLGKFSIVGIDEIEERTAQDLEEFAALFTEAAKRVRELIK